jgi:hypothetical protein
LPEVLYFSVKRENERKDQPDCVVLGSRPGIAIVGKLPYALWVSDVLDLL